MKRQSLERFSKTYLSMFKKEIDDQSPFFNPVYAIN